MLNLNRVDSYFVDSLGISFERISKGDRVITVCKIISHNNNYILSDKGKGITGVSVLNPEDIDDPVIGANEAFQNALSEIKTDYVKKLVRNYYNSGEIRWDCFKHNKNRTIGFLYEKGMF